uniref:Geranylgeranyl transferase type-2 subunit alpha n=1 Tax=Graphocephala atropunctata TaxID=36148 RepID=A0A1B6LIP6_9HEMI
MHGRVKVRTTAEQDEIKRKERAEKVKLYKAGMSLTFEMREKGDKNEKGLAASAKLLAPNPDIYTLWNIRREILLHLKTLKSDEEYSQMMEEELRLTEICLRSQPKSYGAWHHRCWVLDNMMNPSWKTELALCDKYLSYDDRNFHCWDYRRFVVKRSGVSAEEELKFTDEKIAENFSNYSAWHLRSNLLPQVFPDPNGLKPIEDNQHKHELELVTSAAFTDPYDQSAWFYQRWLLGRHTPELRITHITATKQVLCLSFNRSISPSSSDVTVTAYGNGAWTTADGEVSSYVWKRTFAEATAVRDVAQVPVELVVGGEVKQSASLTVEGEQACYREHPVFEASFSPGVTEVLCNVLDSCQTLLELEPDTKWPLLTSVSLMQAIDRKKYKVEVLKYLNLLAKIDHLRANYYSDLKSRCVMEHQLEEWDLGSDFCLIDSGLTALYHAQCLLPARRVDLRHNRLSRSLPRLSCLQFCQVLILDENNLQSLQGFPSLPNLQTLSVKKNQLREPEHIEPYITSCSALINLYIDDNPLSTTHEYSNGTFVKIPK